MRISSIVEPADLKEADRLGRYWYAPLLSFVHTKELWIYGGAAVVLTAGGLLGRTHPDWKAVTILWALVLGTLLLRNLYIGWQLRRKAARMNAAEVGMEIAPAGVRMFLPNGSERLVRWEKILDSRVGERVLLLFYLPPDAKLGRRKYFVVPLREMSRADRRDVLELIPPRVRGRSVQRMLETWR